MSYREKSQLLTENLKVTTEIVSSPPDTAGPQPIGQISVIEGAGVTVVQVTKPDTLQDATPTPGNLIINVEVIVENFSRETLHSSPFFFFGER